MTSPAHAIELRVLERGEARQPAPQQPVSWCGRQIKLLPVYLSGLSCILALGATAYEVEKKNWVAVGLCAFVAIAVAIVTYCYWRNIPIKTMEQSAEDLQNTQRTLENRIHELEQVVAENKQTIVRLENSVQTAVTNEQRLEAALSHNQTELKEVTAKLTDAKSAFDRIQVISGQFREGVSELAKKVLNFTNVGNEKLKGQVQEIAATIEKMDHLGLKIDEESRELKENNEQMDVKIQDYKKLLTQLGSVVDVILPDYEAHRASEKEFVGMREQNAEMQKEIAALKNIIGDLEKTKERFAELQKLLEKLHDPAILSKLGDILKSKTA